MIDAETLRQGLGRTLSRTSFPELGEKYEGKVRDNYVRGARRFIVATDRLSAFDRVVTTLPFKGQVLNRLSAFWFAETGSLAPNHLVGVPDPNVSEVVECTPLPVEIVVRAYITGVTTTSIWHAYERGERVFCGHRLPERLRKNERLPHAIVTPSTKAPKGQHDRSVSRDELLAEGRISEADFDAASSMCLNVFEHGARLLESRGLILVDTKYEIGRRRDGTIVLIDEVHTPDSSRIWYERSYSEALGAGKDPEGLDKEYVRRWLKGSGYAGDGDPPVVPDDVRLEAARRYIEAYEVITAESFAPDLSGPVERIRRKLGLLPEKNL